MTLFEVEPVIEPAAPEGPLVRVRMLVAYDGREFRGFAVNRDVPTVAGSLGSAIARHLRLPHVKISCAGRTDAGVHAWGQVAHIDIPEELPSGRKLDLHALQRSCNRSLAPSIVVRAIDLAPEGFHSRWSAISRSYRYTIVNRPAPDPFLAATAWHVDHPLDMAAMQKACDALIGEHDFTTFCKKSPDNGSLVRRITDTTWRDLGDGVLRFDISASSFCHQMVRSVVGTLAEVGLGRRVAGDMAWTLRSRDRNQAGPPAPPHGLCLWEVGYPPELALRFAPGRPMVVRGKEAEGAWGS